MLEIVLFKISIAICLLLLQMNRLQILASLISNNQYRYQLFSSMDPNTFCLNIDYGTSKALHYTIYKLILHTCKIQFQINKKTSVALIS